jgi:hypothetical protein
MDEAIKDRDMMSGLEWVLPGKAAIPIKRIGGNGPQSLYFGDSNMGQYMPRIKKLMSSAKPSDRGALIVVAGGMPPIPAVSSPDHGDPLNRTVGCLELLGNDPRIDRVVIAARWDYYFKKDTHYRINRLLLSENEGKEEALSRLGELISEISKQGKQVTLVLGIPSGKSFDPKELCSRSFLGSYRMSNTKTSRQEYIVQCGGLLYEIASIARKNGARIIDPMDYLCTNGVCIAEDEDGVPIRYDEGHLRPGYVRDHVKYLDATVEP